VVPANPNGSAPTDAPHASGAGWLFLICAAAAALRLMGLAWGAPYFHFHIDEHFVMAGAELLRQSLDLAANSPKFFMYGPLPMWMLNGVRGVYEWVVSPLDLTAMADQITYMVMGRAISAVLGTACVPLAYLIARRVAGRAAGLTAAVLVATAVVHLRESHFFSVDISMLFFAVVTWLFAHRIADSGRLRDYLLAGVGLGAALTCKYSAAFLLGVLAVAHVCAPGRPSRGEGRAWSAWLARGMAPLVVAAAVFVAVDPMAILYFDKFRQDVQNWVVGPASGAWRPIFIAQFADVEHPALYWFTNLLWWGLGPALEIAGLLGVVWLLLRRDRHSIVAASFPVAYYAAAAQTAAPHVRYAVPLAVGLAVAAGVLCADLLARRRLRRPGLALTGLVCGTTALYAAAYMNVFVSRDSRLAAADWLRARVPRDARVLVEPSHNIPPMGTYRDAVRFDGDYVMWGTAPSNTDRHDYYHLHVLDTYRTLYKRGPSDDDRRRYIASRLALADWIVMDDTFVEFYAHLPEDEHGVVKQYYQDLFAGRLGFELVRSFKVYPSLLGVTINDDAAELTFRLFDHPRIFVFRRKPGAKPSGLTGGAT
jgi:4-amino-4-deoxy-L-arabinose transferase-like glycosyltransferase